LAIEPDVRFLNAWRWALELEFRLAGLPAGRTLIAGEMPLCASLLAGGANPRGVEPATGQILPTGQWLNARLCSMASGRRYALEVAIATEMTRWPFSVTPKQRQADLVFLAPTFTSLAYADERLPLERFPRLCDMLAIASPRPIN
jgi:hypothetical protein